MKTILPLLIAWLFIGCAASNSPKYDFYNKFNDKTCEELFEKKQSFEETLHDMFGYTFNKKMGNDVLAGLGTNFNIVGGAAGLFQKPDPKTEQLRIELESSLDAVNKNIKDKNCIN